MTRAVGDGRRVYNLRPTIRPRSLPRTAHETLKASQRSLRSAVRQERSEKSGKRSAKLVQPGDDPLHEWPAVKILDERLVERNGKPSKEYLIRWKPGPRGEKYEPTWEPCENANGALREYYDSRTRKKAVGRPVDAERALLTGNAVQTMRLASDEAPDTNSTDHCRVVADKAKAYPRRAVKGPRDSKRPGPAAGAAKNRRSHAGATIVSSMIRGGRHSAIPPHVLAALLDHPLTKPDLYFDEMVESKWGQYVITIATQACPAVSLGVTCSEPCTKVKCQGIQYSPSAGLRFSESFGILDLVLIILTKFLASQQATSPVQRSMKPSKSVSISVMES